VLHEERELPVALLALGLEPSPRVLRQCALASPSGAVDLATLEKLVADAHIVCPYSNATRNNVAVSITVE
jgi:hypothetical protein